MLEQIFKSKGIVTQEGRCPCVNFKICIHWGNQVKVRHSTEIGLRNKRHRLLPQTLWHPENASAESSGVPG